MDSLTAKANSTDGTNPDRDLADFDASILSKRLLGLGIQACGVIR